MTRGQPAAAGVLAAVAATLALAASPAAGQAPFAPPDCAPGSPPIPPPTVSVSGSAATARVVVGRPFTIEYQVPVGVIVHDTRAPAGVTFAAGDPSGVSPEPTAAAPGSGR